MKYIYIYIYLHIYIYNCPAGLLREVQIFSTALDWNWHRPNGCHSDTNQGTFQLPAQLNNCSSAHSSSSTVLQANLQRSNTSSHPGGRQAPGWFWSC